jgi:uncharacterized Zn finger protein (UPF0148 family)
MAIQAVPDVICANHCDWRGVEEDLVEDYAGPPHCPKCGSNWAIVDDSISNMRERAEKAIAQARAEGAAEAAQQLAAKDQRIAELERVNEALRDSREVLRSKVSELERIFAKDSQRIAELEARLTAIVAWLEKNESSVFSRGLWDAIHEADAALAQKGQAS